MTPVIIYFFIGETRAVGTRDLPTHEPGSFRLVVEPGTLKNLSIEVEAKDRRGASSWRPAKMNDDMHIEVLALALMKSQMTPLQRVESPQMLHPDGVLYMSGECEIRLGRIRCR